MNRRSFLARIAAVAIAHPALDWRWSLPEPEPQLVVPWRFTECHFRWDEDIIISKSRDSGMSTLNAARMRQIWARMDKTLFPMPTFKDTT